MGYNDEMLEETYKLAKDNNKMLRRMRRAAWFSSILKLIFWAAIIGIPAWLYYEYAGPIVGQLMDTISQVQDVGTKLQNASNGVQQLQQLDQGSTAQILDLLNSIPGIKMSN